MFVDNFWYFWVFVFVNVVDLFIKIGGDWLNCDEIVELLEKFFE